jgi:hypothetical protein
VHFNAFEEFLLSKFSSGLEVEKVGLFIAPASPYSIGGVLKACKKYGLPITPMHYHEACLLKASE